MSQTPGMSEGEAREFLERLLAKQEGSTTFYWEHEETQEAVDLIVDAVAKLLAANNARVEADRRAKAFRSGLGM